MEKVVLPTFEFNKENHKIATVIIQKYPSNQRFSALMPLLTLAQKQNNNYLSKEVINYIATYLNVSVVSVYEVATFYSMYNLEPVGKYTFQVCNSVLCNALGSDQLYKLCKKITKTEKTSVSEDGLFSVKEVECLGACVNAPALKINDFYHNDTSEQSLVKIVSELKNHQELKVTTIVQKSLQHKG